MLQEVDFVLRPGEVHALVGENGAGKSTLMKILSGVHPFDSGAILLNGKDARISSPHDARRAGIGMIYQEHTLAPHLTVAENILLGLEPVRALGLIDRRALESRAAQVLSSHNFPLRPSARVLSLSRAEKQLAEIARALTGARRIVVMDEPTAMLSQRESEGLFRTIRRLREHGLAIAYISHRIEELEQIADCITILRDGRRVYSGAFSSVNSADVIRHMVGRKIEDLYPGHTLPVEEVLLEVEGFGDGVRYRDIAFKVHRGEILGIAGLIGAGRTEMARGLFGLEPATRGTVRVHGQTVRFRSPGEAIASGLACLPEDRKITGLFPHLALAHNITIAALGRISRGPFLRRSCETRACRELMGRLKIRARSERQPVCRLSGGNQQKALIARWLFAGSGILILDEPTQGVDLGARVEIYNVMREIVGNGGAIIMISSDLPELLGMSHRIAVMRRGEIVANLRARETNQEEIMRYATLA